MNAERQSQIGEVCSWPSTYKRHSRIYIIHLTIEFADYSIQMYSMAKTFTYFVAFATVVLGANHVSNKKTAFPNLGFNEAGLTNALKLPSHSHKQWPWGTLPKFCYNAAIPKDGLSPLYHCNPYDVEVYDLKYSDVREISSSSDGSDNVV
jgi:hypothetical protein